MDKIYKALADGNRRRILFWLSKKEFSVNELLENFEITQATLSNHLAILRKAGLVGVRVAGKQRIYSLVKENLRKVVEELSFWGLEGASGKRVNLC